MAPNATFMEDLIDRLTTVVNLLDSINENLEVLSVNVGEPVEGSIEAIASNLHRIANHFETHQ